MNLPGNAQDSIDASVRIMRIITAALITGICGYLGYVLLQNPFALPPRGERMALIGASFAALNIVAYFAVPPFIRAAKFVVPNSPDQQASGLFLNRLIVRLALMEGAAFCNTFAVMSEGNWWSLAIIGGMLFLMIVQWPTRTKLEEFIDSQRLEKSLRAPE
jgi:hypothetical protein